MDDDFVELKTNSILFFLFSISDLVLQRLLVLLLFNLDEVLKLFRDRTDSVKWLVKWSFSNCSDSLIPWFVVCLLSFQLMQWFSLDMLKTRSSLFVDSVIIRSFGLDLRDCSYIIPPPSSTSVLNLNEVADVNTYLFLSSSPCSFFVLRFLRKYFFWN